MKDFRDFVHDRAQPPEKDVKVVKSGGMNSAAKFRKSGSALAEAQDLYVSVRLLLVETRCAQNT